MNREAVMSTWAEVIVAGNDTSAATAHSIVGYDPELEKQRLAWEMKRYDEEREYQRKRDVEEREIRKKEIALKEAKIKKVEIDNDLRRKCEEEQLRLKNEELKLRQDKLARQVEKDNIERAKTESVATKMKIFGDAMRGTAFKMSNDPIKMIPFFDYIDNLFHDLKVDVNIKVKLIRPFLNDRTRSLLSRMDVSQAEKYDLVKRYFCCTNFNCHLEFIWNVFMALIVYWIERICCSHHV